MVAIIKTGSSIHNIFNYNENKVKQGVAECIGEGNYPADVDKMNRSMKLNRLLKQNALNENVTRNSIHISLNFDPSETGLPKEKLVDIANIYMQKIGLGDQPYLIYQHRDAGHPHIHLVSIKVREDGSRIDMHNVGRNQSEAARKEIEILYGLVRAEGRKNKEHNSLQPIAAGKISYGKIQSKKAISNVLEGVLSSYKYSSLSELNAVLQQYNVLADRGSETSRVFKAGGLVYRILDQQGKPIGVPIKASDFYNKPTLRFLEEKFILNKNSKTSNIRIRNSIDTAFLKKKITLPELIKVLDKEGISTVLRKTQNGMIYGITYVDHKTKCVYNGSSLGKQYSAKALQERCMADAFNTSVKTSDFPDIKRPSDEGELKKTSGFSADAALKVIDLLMQSEEVLSYVPKELKGRRKKRKRKGQSDH